MGTLRNIDERKRSYFVRVQVHGVRYTKAFRFTWQNRSLILKHAITYRDRLLYQRSGATPFHHGRNNNK